MKGTLALRLYALTLLLAILWVLLGAPFSPEEWLDIPHRLSLMAAQLPGRMAGIFSRWR